MARPMPLYTATSREVSGTRTLAVLRRVAVIAGKTKKRSCGADAEGGQRGGRGWRGRGARFEEGGRRHPLDRVAHAVGRGHGKIDRRRRSTPAASVAVDSTTPGRATANTASRH